MVKLLDWLEDLDDVQEVYSNADLPAEAYEDRSGPAAMKPAGCHPHPGIDPGSQRTGVGIIDVDTPAASVRAPLRPQSAGGRFFRSAAAALDDCAN